MFLLALHQQKKMASTAVVQAIRTSVCDAGSSWRKVPLHYQNWKLMIEWGLPHKILDCQKFILLVLTVTICIEVKDRIALQIEATVADDAKRIIQWLVTSPFNLYTSIITSSTNILSLLLKRNPFTHILFSVFQRVELKFW